MLDEDSARLITVMSARFHESAMTAVQEGRAGAYALDAAQSGIMEPAVRENNGVVAQSAGAGILSYFENALDAVRAAARIQTEMDALNMAKRFKTPLLARVGMHSGKCMVREHALAGAAVDAACCIEAAADAGGILLSEETWKALSGTSEIHCRFVKQVMLKDAQEPCNAYKAFWNPQEIELEIAGRNALPRQEYGGPVRSSGMKVVWGVLAMIGIVLLLTLGSKYFGAARRVDGVHSISDSANPASARDALR